MYQTITEDEKRKVYETFGRNEKSVEDDVLIIKTWMRTQPHLPEMMDDASIKNFLNLSKFSIEKTKERIDMYYTVRSLIPDFFERSNPKLENVKKVFENSYEILFPNLVDGVHRVHFWKQKKQNTLKVPDKAAVVFATFEMRLHEDFMVDDIYVADFSCLSLNDVKEMTPTIVSNFFAVYKKVYALRLKRIIYINCPSYMSFVLSILKLVLKPKLYERIELYADDSGIKKLFPKEVLPKDYGGDGPSLDELNEMTYRKLVQYQDRFDELDKLRVDERLRPQNLDNDEILGYYGSFKKINLD